MFVNFLNNFEHTFDIVLPLELSRLLTHWQRLQKKMDEDILHISLEPRKFSNSWLLDYTFYLINYSDLPGLQAEVKELRWAVEDNGLLKHPERYGLTGAPLVLNIAYEMSSPEHDIKLAYLFDSKGQYQGVHAYSSNMGCEPPVFVAYYLADIFDLSEMALQRATNNIDGNMIELSESPKMRDLAYADFRTVIPDSSYLHADQETGFLLNFNEYKKHLDDWILPLSNILQYHQLNYKQIDKATLKLIWYDGSKKFWSCLLNTSSDYIDLALFGFLNQILVDSQVCTHRFLAFQEHGMGTDYILCYVSEAQEKKLKHIRALRWLDIEWQQDV